MKIDLKNTLILHNLFYEEILITSALRTPVGSLNKSLKNIPADELGAAVITASTEKLKIKKDQIDEIIMGQVLTGALVRTC